MVRSYFLPAILLLTFSYAHAQVGFGGEIGFNGSRNRVTVNGADQDTKMRYGIRGGALADIRFANNFYFQPGLYYAANGYKRNFTGGHDEYNINAIEVPLNIIFKYETGPGWLFAGAGPFIGYNVNGYYKVVSPLFVDSKSDLRVGGGATDEIRNLDAGVGINAGYQLFAGLFFRLRAQVGLVNMSAPVANSDNTNKSFSFGFTAGYIFYGGNNGYKLHEKKKKKKIISDDGADTP